MKPSISRTYRTAAFAELAGVTPRALHHYDRLGLLTPRRSEAGYRIYTERDLETLEEIVALKFIGVPLKQIGELRHRSSSSFASTLRAQRETLEVKQRLVAQAISAIGAAEASLRAGTPINATLFRRIIKVMHMDTNQEDVIACYSTLLKAKMAHLQALTGDERTALREQWAELVNEISGALDEDPAEPRAQGFLNRWLSLLQAVSGATTADMDASIAEGATFRPTAEMRDALWARRAEWLPEGATSQAPVSSEDAMAQARAKMQGAMQGMMGDPRVWDFIKRVQAAGR